MSIWVTRWFLLWCSVINYGILLVWFVFLTFAHDWIDLLHGKWFRLPIEQFTAIHYAGMFIFKIGIIPLKLVPYVALRIVS